MSNELEKIERQLEQTEDDEITISLLYQKIDILQAKANKYDSLVEKIKEKMKDLKENKSHKYTAGTTVVIVNELQELLDTEK